MPSEIIAFFSKTIPAFFPRFCMSEIEHMELRVQTEGFTDDLYCLYVRGFHMPRKIYIYIR